MKNVKDRLPVKLSKMFKYIFILTGKYHKAFSHFYQKHCLFGVLLLIEPYICKSISSTGHFYCHSTEMLRKLLLAWQPNTLAAYIYLIDK